MDNENLEIVNMEPVEATGRFPWGVNGGSPVTSQILPIGAGVAAGIGIGLAICHFLVEPIIAKRKAAKVEAVTPVETTNESKKEEE